MPPIVLNLVKIRVQVQHIPLVVIQCLVCLLVYALSRQSVVLSLCKIDAHLVSIRECKIVRTELSVPDREDQSIIVVFVDIEAIAQEIDRVCLAVATLDHLRPGGMVPWDTRTGKGNNSV
jgi:hypothetical protein